jgi:hypothetical protein
MDSSSSSSLASGLTMTTSSASSTGLAAAISLSLSILPATRFVGTRRAEGGLDLTVSASAASLSVKPVWRKLRRSHLPQCQGSSLSGMAVPAGQSGASKANERTPVQSIRTSSSGAGGLTCGLAEAVGVKCVLTAIAADKRAAYPRLRRALRKQRREKQKTANSASEQKRVYQHNSARGSALERNKPRVGEKQTAQACTFFAHRTDDIVLVRLSGVDDDDCGALCAAM